VTPEQAIEDAHRGKLRPVYLLVGEEQYWQARVQKALREGAVQGGVPGLNEDTFTAGETTAKAVLAACHTLPMMATRRFVLVRGLERWESSEQELEQLGRYLETSNDSTVLVLTAPKLDMRRRFCARARKEGLVVECESPKPVMLPVFVQNAAKARGNTLAKSTAELLATLIGADLAQLDDAVERLSLFVGKSADGKGKEIDENAVGACFDVVQPATVWDLVNAVGSRDAGAALAALSRVLTADESEIRLLSLLAWSARQLLRFTAARQQGMNSADAAKAAGAPPFKAAELDQQMRRVSSVDLIAWLEALARADLDLKGGSKRTPQAVLEEAILTLCRRSPRARQAHA
jgi:DNA polymerase-3 subunit delta